MFCTGSYLTLLVQDNLHYTELQIEAYALKTLERMLLKDNTATGAHSQLVQARLVFC